ncbi:MAG: phosphatidate cytidylyltransferase [Atopobiaceae bacterium]|jgi:phosphatidate cytidylyltransferase|nr:phosphatidate cytidylyltransferase [Atopobiaceae bacterium]MCH4180034.1 phosphatidate cytidylyltransferase [Atopobiaceae bacterium]MCH4213914.1 phosphatidate cytidylyltransferase [Atopobiaceae bacterium]MCH4229836.1 phosphatidate cytidylyltransferase [Atopobiaceae bacterium]MCH4275623.1 phosphatidate cytidylyltransferase [Atopobiaceae bacterium]
MSDANGPASQESASQRDDRRAAREERREAHESQRVVGDLKSQKVRGGAERVLTRTTSGAIYAITILVCLYLGPIATDLLVAAMSWLCCSEFFRIIRMGGRMPNEFIGLAFAVAFPVSVLLHGSVMLFLLFCLVFAVGVWYVATPRASIADVAATVFGPVYTGLMLSAIVSIRVCDAGGEGALLTFAVMASVWINDAAAYFVGSRIGRHPLAPRISPHKSIEGLVGGILGSLVVWLAIAFIGVRSVSLPLAVCAALLSAAASVMGDLFESRLKRGAGVKDSGNLMPGHGGLLDRSDSMIFGCMVAYFVLLMGGVL